MMKKRAIAFMLSLCVGLGMISPIIGKAASVENNYNIENPLSSEQMKIELDNGSMITVVIPSHLIENITTEEIYSFISIHNLTTDCLITFIGENKVEEVQVASESLLPYIYNTEKTPIGNPYIAKSVQIESVAKGMTKRLGKLFRESLTTTITSGYPYIPGEIGGTVTKEYSAEQTFTGPPESSEYNTRVYYENFFEQKVSWRQERYIYSTLESWTAGTATVALYSHIVSVDLYELPLA